MIDDTDAFYKLIWPQAPMLLRVAQTLCPDPADAEDVVQETLLRAFRHLDQFVEGTSIRSWLLAILRNTRVDYVRRVATRHRELSLEDETIAEAAARPPAPLAPELAWSDPQALLESLSDQELISALLEVPEEIRWALLLVDVEALEMKEAAKVMGIPEGTVKSRLHRGRGMLRKRLEPVVAQRAGWDRGVR